MVNRVFVYVLKVYVLVYDKLTDNQYLWTKAKFLNRQSYMQDMYGTFEHTGSVPIIPQVTEMSFAFYFAYFLC